MASYHSGSESSTNPSYETEYSKLFQTLADATPAQLAEMIADDAQRIKLKAAFQAAANHERELQRTRKEYMLLYEEETDLLNLNDQLLKENTALEKSKARSKHDGGPNAASKTSEKTISINPPSSSPVKASTSKTSKHTAKRAPTNSEKPTTKKRKLIDSTPIKKDKKVVPKEKARQLLVSLEELLAIRTNVTDEEKAKFDGTEKLKVRFRITPIEIAALQLIRPVKKLNRMPKSIKGTAIVGEEVAEDEQGSEDDSEEEPIGGKLGEDFDAEIEDEAAERDELAEGDFGDDDMADVGDV